MVGFFPLPPLTPQLWLLSGGDWRRDKTYGAGSLLLGWRCGDLVLLLGVSACWADLAGVQS